ncbi:MAG: hypothetical protein BWY54_00511 [Candidatus Dependentiae bacterium ADurb.Bin331]|nr:MAG: hypothetical protein BWY54_00511 [Candidatus Dependentiae bacterium ADurb.Bin331]
MKKALLLTSLVFIIILNLQPQEHSLSKTFEQLKQLGERYKKPESKPTPITAAINKGTFENIYELFQDVTKDIANEDEKIRWFVAQLHDESLTVRKLIEDFFKERSIHLLRLEFNESRSDAEIDFRTLESFTGKEIVKAGNATIEFSWFIPYSVQNMIKEAIKNDSYFNNETIGVVQNLKLGGDVGVTRTTDNKILIIFGLGFYLLNENAQYGTILHELEHVKRAHLRKRRAIWESKNIWLEQKKQLSDEEKRLSKALWQMHEYEADISPLKQGAEYSSVAEFLAAVDQPDQTIESSKKAITKFFSVGNLLLLGAATREVYFKPDTVGVLLLLVATPASLFALKKSMSMGKTSACPVPESERTHPATEKRYQTAKLIVDLIKEEARLLGKTLD